MRCHVILNQDGGTLKTADIDALSALIVKFFESNGHKLDVEIVRGKEVASAIERSAASKMTQCLIVGGGDGTVSIAASECWKHKKVLGILPFGTMNFFARSLGIPLEAEPAIAALAASKPRYVDIAAVNGRPFVHQVSLGVQVRMIELRDKIPYASRAGKIRASAWAAIKTIVRPPSFRARLVTGGVEDNSRFSVIAVTNNQYGDGHLPFADRLDQGVLGIYVAPRLSFFQNIKLARDLAFGRWTENQHFLSASSGDIHLRLGARFGSRKMSVDGELISIKKSLNFKMHPLGLRVLMPKEK